MAKLHRERDGLHVSMGHHELAESVAVDELIRPQTPHEDQSTSKILKIFVGLLLFSIVVTCTVLSKLSLIYLLTCLNDTIRQDGSPDDRNIMAASLYWQLLFIVLIPQFVTFARTLFFGVCGKQSHTFPWPTRKAFVIGAVASAFEVVAMSFMVFYALPRLPPVVAILAMGGVFPFQTLVDCFYLKWWPNDCHNRGYMDLSEDVVYHHYHHRHQGYFARFMKMCANLLENKFSRGFALFLQVAAIIVLATFAALQFTSEGSERRYLLPITIVVSVVVLSVVWSTKVQQESNRAHNVARRNQMSNVVRERDAPVPTARFKAGFINSSIQIVLYMFVPYIVFHYTSKIDPWHLASQAFRWQADGTLSFFLVQILGSFFGYTFMWVSCTMVLHRWGLALPMYLCTPISVGVCVIIQHTNPSKFFYLSCLEETDSYHPPMVVAGIILWVGQILTMAAFIWNKKNVILAKDADMFLSPRYDGVFFEQHALLNRQVKKGKKSRGSVVQVSDNTRPRTIFVCSTMYREDIEEMKQMLSSIYQLACHYQRKKDADPGYRDHFESHIFLDGGANGTQLTYFALQLFSLFEETLHVDPKVFQRIDTPYGCQLSWDIVDTMPIYVHLKDGFKVKNKKRWSQVMYMNYVLNFRVKKNVRNLRNWRRGGAGAENERLDDDNTFILTTDADIQFTPESAVVLLDRLDSDPQVGVVCARTHPQGSGPLYWYQLFDYAIGHWFQKAAEDIMGTVLCCPGCFSVFRCRALRSVLEEYSSEVTTASEFLTKDMGEDRWLCTLLVENGWRLSYCAISENYTHCPETMDEFFKQRRRWIPSTVANLSLLISHASQIIKGNDRVSILFVMFEAIMVFSTAISPATVILVIAAGFTSAFQVDPLKIVIPLLFFCVAYAILCLYGDPQLQLDVAQACTLLFCLLMGVVMSGYVANIVDDIRNFTSSITANNSDLQGGELPTFLAPSTIYLLIFALVFIIAAMLHPNEWTCLLHFVWYLIALPSGYLLLLVYSAANLDNRSWGTREGGTGGQVGIYKSAATFAQKVWTRITLCADQCTCRPVIPPTEVKAPPPVHEVEVTQPGADLIDEDEFKLKDDVIIWLRQLECDQFGLNFQREGYFTLHFIAAMKSEDFKAIGITDRGHRLRLEREAKRLPSLPIETSIPDDVVDWLDKLELRGYQRLFDKSGYSSKADLESIKGLTLDDLKKMGIHKRAHQQKILEGTNRLAYPSAVDISISQSKSIIETCSTQQEPLQADDEETRFWIDILRSKLEPVKASFITDTDLKEKLRALRNTVLCVMLLINVMWIVLLFSLNIPISDRYKIPNQALTLLFLFLYTVILLVQFFAMIAHRCVTLVHYLARVGPGEE